jgi:hypothetical protein
MIFWDYDTQWAGDRWRAGQGPMNLGELEFANTDRLLELHAEYDVPACFAVVGSAALPGTRPYHDPDQVRRIHAAGHEIASHSHRHEWLPGLDRASLLETLRASKDALEQCVGSQVTSFVPPFNQPYDYPQGGAFCFSERREAGRTRTDLRSLCQALKETGYAFCRMVYRPMHLWLIERLFHTRLDRPTRPEMIAGVTCVQLNAPCGFAGGSVAMVDRCVREGGMVVVYGHPHSLHKGTPQDERWLVPFLEHVQELSRQGVLEVRLPRECVRSAQPAEANA